MTQVLFLFKHLNESKWKIILLIMSMSFLSISYLIYPWLLKLMVDTNMGREDFYFELNYFIALLIILFVIAAFLGVHVETMTQKIGFKLRNSLRLNLFRVLIRQPLSFHKDSKTGALTSLATEDLGKIQTLCTSVLTPLYQNTLFKIGCIILMCKINVMATLLVLAIIVLSLPAIVFYSRKFRLLSMDIQERHAEANAIFEESLIAIREVQAFLQQPFVMQRYFKRQDEAFQTEMKSTALNPRINLIVRMLLSGILLMIFYIGISGITIPGWSVGGSIAFYMYAYSMTMTILSTGRLIFSIQSILGAVSRTMSLVDERLDTGQSGGFHRQTHVRGQITFRNLSFEYSSERKVFLDINFEFEAGSWILIKGPSGSGKSTIANLLMGFYQPQSGDVCVDGTPVREWDIQDLRSHIGYVGQDPFLFHGTLKENILLERPNCEARLDHIVKICCLDQFIADLPLSLSTLIGERGLTLSGGQKSRVAIARALAADPDILILDEANSMLEPELEETLWRNIWLDRQNKTTVILTHHDEYIPKVYSVFDLETHLVQV